jgi:hypothetical protein
MSRLSDLQRQFGEAIVQPLDAPLEADFIAPSATLTAEERLRIYNQQYWFRLLSVLQEGFPLLLRLFGHGEFNERIAIPYLAERPPNGWTLAELGRELPSWLQPREIEVVRLAAEIDLAFETSFIAADGKKLTGEPETLLHQRLRLHPSLHLIETERNLLSVRGIFLSQEVEHWLEHPFPDVPRGQFFQAIYRTSDNRVTWRDLEPGEFRQLVRLQSLAEMSEVDPAWIQRWVVEGWLCL